MAEPRLGRTDEPPRHQGAVVASERAHGKRGLSLVPRQFQCPGGQLAGGRLIVERGERLAGLDLAGGDQLRHGKGLDAPPLFVRIDVGDRRVRGAQIEPDDVSTGGRYRRTTLFHRCLRCHATRRDRSMFSANHPSEKHVFAPKNGPVPRWATYRSTPVRMFKGEPLTASIPCDIRGGCTG